MEQKTQIPLQVNMLPVQKLQAGDLHCLYEHGNLRYVKCVNTEILRMIYGAVRDKDWATVPYTVTNEEIEQGSNSFRITYTALYHKDDIQYRAHFEIEGKSDQTISFTMRGEALSDFYRNRVGLCVLHPVKECAGKEVRIIRPDNSSYTATFPESISPHQPFVDIQQMMWDVNGATVHLSFAGEVFETEDQRNWSDNSYKTYGTPLSLPRPVLVRKGDKLEQKIVVNLRHAGTNERKGRKEATGQRKPFPALGITRPGIQARQKIELLKHLPVQYYRVELNLTDDQWHKDLSSAAEEARVLGVKLELIVFTTPNEADKQLEHLFEQLEPVSDEVASILPLQQDQKVTPVTLLQHVHSKIKTSFPHIKIGYGTDAYFAELNRERPRTELFDFLSCSINPQVHSSDERSIIENLKAQEYILHTIKSFAGDKEIYISPVTLGRRKNPDAAEPVYYPPDERTNTGFAAAWILNSMYYLSGADRITYGQLFETENNFEMPLYHVLQKLGDMKPQWIGLQDAADDTILHDVVAENNEGVRMEITIARQ